jgi:polysaccharide pyruvyl transferase WcaK-like protein
LGFTVRQFDYGIAARDSFIDALLGCDGLVSSRLHPAVVAMGTGIPVMQVSATSPKMAGVFGRIGLQPIVATPERHPNPQQWQLFFRAIVGNDDDRAGAAVISASNVAAFRSAGAACAFRLERLFYGLAGIHG